MERSFNGLIRLITTISRNLISSVILIIAIIIFFVLLFIHAKYQHIGERFPTVAQEQLSFNRSVILNDLIISELQDIQKTLGADRVNLHQFRNGQFDLAGVPFNFAGISFSASAPGISMDDRATTAVPLSVYNDLIPFMWHIPTAPVCMKRDIDQITHPVLRYRMQDRGTQLMYICPIVTPAGSAVGFITVEYLRREANRPNDGQMYERIRLGTQRTATYLIRTSMHN